VGYRRYTDLDSTSHYALNVLFFVVRDAINSPIKLHLMAGDYHEERTIILNENDSRAIFST
jgi:hypothetical protein